MPVPDSERATLVLGVGNLLWADEGFGVRAVEALNARYQFPDRVQLMDGGTQGMFLLPYVQSAQELLILDAVDFGLEPGTLCVVTGDAVPQSMGAKKVSMHQTGFQEVLAVALMTGRLPQQLALVGIQPERIDDFGGSLQPRIEAALPEAVARAVEVLETWGIVPETRRQPDTAEPTGPAVRLYASPVQAISAMP